MPWLAVSIVPDLTQLQRKEEKSLRKEAMDMNAKMTRKRQKISAGR